MGGIVEKFTSGAADAALNAVADGQAPGLKVVGAGVANIFCPMKVGPKPEKSVRADQLHQRHYKTSDKLEAVSAIFSSEIYFAGKATVVMFESNHERATAFYLSENDANIKDWKAKQAAVHDYIPDGTRVELLSDVGDFQDGDCSKLINVRFQAASGYVRKAHCKSLESHEAGVLDYKSELQNAINRSSENSEDKLDVEVKYGSIKRDSSLLNSVATAVVVIDEKPTLIIAWSGTDLAKRPMDVLTDAGAAPAACQLWFSKAPFIHAHSSIAAQTQGNFLLFKKRILHLLKEYKCKDLVFTGHSLGGACAMVAHMCTIGQALEEGLGKEFPDINVRSISFAGLMPFYRIQHSDDKCFEAACQQLEMDPGEVRANEAKIRSIFQQTSKNLVCAMDIVPRLAGKPDFYRPAVRETMGSLASSQVMEVLNIDAQSLAEKASKITDKVLDTFFDKNASPDTFRDLSCFEHLSTVRYMEHEADGNLKLHDLTPEAFKRIPWQETKSEFEGQIQKELHAYQYYFACHSWFPNAVRYQRNPIAGGSGGY